jgi:hypothetical protein
MLTEGNFQAKRNTAGPPRRRTPLLPEAVWINFTYKTYERASMYPIFLLEKRQQARKNKVSSSTVNIFRVFKSRTKKRSDI